MSIRRSAIRFASIVGAVAMALMPASGALAIENTDASANQAATQAATPFNLATLATVTASGQEVSGRFGPTLAADNKDLPADATNPSVHNAADASRWSADGGSGPWWLAYEFPGKATITSINIGWGNTYATDYSIQTSTDGQNWTDVKTGLKASAKAQWVETKLDQPLVTSHIRMKATAKSQNYSLSVWEMRVMGTITAEQTDPLSRLTPKPLYSQNLSGGTFTFTDDTCVYLKDDSLKAAADVLRESLGESYGLKLPIGDSKCAVSFELDKNLDVSDKVSGTQSISKDESYTITTSKSVISVKARSATAGIWASQSLIQLVGPWANSTVKLAAQASVPSVRIEDAPRYQWRGLLLDPARSFYTADEVKTMIDVMSAYKMNTLHIHLTDDEGARIEITNEGRAAGDTTDYTKLAEKSSKLGYPSAYPNNAWSPAIDGLPGYYTQAQFTDLVTYAANRGIAIVPEIDGPGHSLGLLHGLKELNVGNSNPKPAAGKDTPDLTKETQGRSSLATDSEITYTVLGHIMDQLDSMIDKGIAASSMPSSEIKRQYFHMGGDELFLGGGTGDKVQREQQYLGRVGDMIKKDNKTAIVWNDGLAAVDQIPEGSVVQHWTGNAATSENIQKLLNQRNGKIIMSPATNAYFPQKPGNELTGVSWACSGACTTSNFYNWNPTTQAGTTEEKVLGVEDALWSEHLRSLNDAELLMYTRLMATAEVGWTQQDRRDYADWVKRASDIGIDLMNRGNNFHKASEISWKGSYVAVDSAAQKLADGGKAVIGRYAEPGLTSTDGVHVTATYTKKDGTTVDLPVELAMKTAFGAQSQDANGKLIVNSAHMNSIVDVIATLPADALASADEAVGTIDVTVSSDSYPIPSASAMSIATKGGRIVQAWVGERPSIETPGPKPDPDQDTTDPVIKGADDVTIEQGASFDPRAGVTAEDDVDGDLTASIKVSGSVDTSKPETYELTYSVSDKAGNTATVTRKVTVKAKDTGKKDNVAPVIKGADDVTILVGAKFDPRAGVTAFDDVDGDVTTRISGYGRLDVNTPGTYTFTYRVSDKAGNITTVVRTVTVKAKDTGKEPGEPKKEPGDKLSNTGASVAAMAAAAGLLVVGGAAAMVLRKRRA